MRAALLPLRFNELLDLSDSIQLSRAGFLFLRSLPLNRRINHFLQTIWRYLGLNLSRHPRIRAFNLAGIQKSIIPDKEEELRRWDTEFIELCRNAVNTLNQKNGTEKVQSEEEKYYRAYKSQSDTTNYKGWHWLGDITYAQLASYFQSSIETHEKQLNYNNQK